MSFQSWPSCASWSKLLRQSVCARDDFIAIAAHELRNPMTPIFGVAELTLIAARNAEGECPPRVITLLEHLQRLVHDCMRRATKLLDVSWLQSGNLQLEPVATELSQLVRSIVHRYEAEAAHQVHGQSAGISVGCALRILVIMAETESILVDLCFSPQVSHDNIG
jgi:signal transduction histidine kinase